MIMAAIFSQSILESSEHCLTAAGTPPQLAQDPDENYVFSPKIGPAVWVRFMALFS